MRNILKEYPHKMHKMNINLRRRDHSLFLLCEYLPIIDCVCCERTSQRNRRLCEHMYKLHKHRGRELGQGGGDIFSPGIWNLYLLLLFGFFARDQHSFCDSKKPV